MAAPPTRSGARPPGGDRAGRDATGRGGTRSARSLRIARVEVILEAGAEPNRVTVDTGAERQTIDIPPNDSRAVTLAMPPGVPYHVDPQFPMNFVYTMSIASASGFIPMFWSGGGDARHLGVFVRIVPHYE